MKANISNVQKIYLEIPRTWEFEGVTYQGYQHFTDLHFEHGWRDVVLPTFNAETHKLSNEYILINDIVTKEVIDLTPEEIAEANKPIVPESISQMKLRKQLILSGISIASIDALIQSLPRPNRDLIYTMWEYAVVFDRSNPELIGLAQMLGLTSEQLDEIFINGNLL